VFRIQGLLCLILMTVLCLSCRSQTPNNVSVSLARLTQAMTQGAMLGSLAVDQLGHTPRDLSPNPLVGEHLFGRYCSACHGSGKNGPKIVGYYDKTPDSESDIAIIRHGLIEMPGFGSRLTEFQIKDLLAYLEASYAAVHAKPSQSDVPAP